MSGERVQIPRWIAQAVLVVVLGAVVVSVRSAQGRIDGLDKQYSSLHACMEGVKRQVGDTNQRVQRIESLLMKGVK